MPHATRCATILCCLAMLTTWAYGQTTATAPAPSTGEMLKSIPAGSMGFLAIGSLKGGAAKAEAFLRETGLATVIPLPAGGSLVDALKEKFRLGEGFEPEGGLALVMLDPQLFGIDVVALISGKVATTQPMPEPPLVILLPGNDPEKMFAEGKPVKEGGVVKFTGVDGDPSYAVQAGKYVMISDNLEALKAAAASTKSMDQQLSAEDKTFIDRNDVAVWVDVKMIAPIADAAIAKMQGEAGEVDGNLNPFSTMMKARFTQISLLLKQASSAMLGLRLEPVGIVIEAQVDCIPDSAYGKALAALQVKTPTLNRLPAMPYILAVTVSGRAKMGSADTEKEIDSALTMEPFKGLSAEDRAKLRTVFLGLNEQIDGAQLYIGGLTGPTGQVGAALVLECQSADKVRDILADAAAVVANVLNTNSNEELKQLQVKYLKAAEDVGGQKVDAVTIEHPDLTNLSEDDRKQMIAILGEDRIRLLVAAADAKTLVITFGGGKAFLTEALKVAQAGSGGLDNDPGIVKANAVLPKERMMAAYFNIGNLFGVIKNVMAATSQPSIPLNISATTPFSLAIAVNGSNVSIVGLIPTDTVADVVQSVLQMMSGGMQTTTTTQVTTLPSELEAVPATAPATEPAPAAGGGDEK